MRGQHGLAEVELVGDEDVGHDAPAGGEARDTAGTAHAVEVPAVAEVGVGCRHRRAAQAELRGEFAFRGQPGAECDASVEDEQPHAIGEGGVRGAVGEVAPADDEGGESAGREGCHPATVAGLASCSNAN